MMKKTLFISDLDGTLLTPDAKLPDDVAARINRLTAEGVMISYATARTVRSVSHILSRINFSLPGAKPVALMNGVLVRDMQNNKYLRAAVLKRDTAAQILDAISSVEGLEPFLYAIDNASPIDGDPLVTYYRRITNNAMESFMNERIERFGKPFLKISNLNEVHGDIVYFAILGDASAICRAAALVEKIPGTRCTYYRDAYNADIWYLEIFDTSASKKHAVTYLKALCGADKVVCFGDNRNDLPMFEAADIAVAVSNAVDEVRKAADFVTADVVGTIENIVERDENDYFGNRKGSV